MQTAKARTEPAEYYIALLGASGQYLCPTCGSVVDEYVMTREMYAARLAAWSRLDAEGQRQQVEDVFRFAFEGRIAMNTRCYDSYCHYPAVDLDALTRMAWKRRSQPREWFLNKAMRAFETFRRRRSPRAYAIGSAYIDLWDMNHPEEALHTP